MIKEKKTKYGYLSTRWKLTIAQNSKNIPFQKGFYCQVKHKMEEMGLLWWESICKFNYDGALPFLDEQG
jgi:hypothetical protein